MQDLESLFQQTQNDYNVIPDFIDQLLETEIYCLGIKNDENKIQFRIFETPEGDQAIPFFLKLDTILQDIGENIEYITINTRKLFEITQGATLILNPTSELSKVFQPEEIKTILDIDQNSIESES